MSIYKFKKKVRAPYKFYLFKTIDDGWLTHPSPAVAVFSLYSAFNKKEETVDVFLSVIASEVKSDKAILIADCAHQHTSQYNDNEVAEQVSVMSVWLKTYCDRYGYRLIKESELENNPAHENSVCKMADLNKNDNEFRHALDLDVMENTRKNPELLYSGYEEDLAKDSLSFLATLMTLKVMGYDYSFYPGKPLNAMNFCSESQLISSFMGVSLCHY